MKKLKILIDLDVVTVALWEKVDNRREIATKFIGKVKSEKFYVVNPTIIIEMVSEWKDKKLRSKIEEFYTMYTNKFVDETEVITLINKTCKFEEITKSLLEFDIKDEDAFLVLTAVSKKLDYLITFNRKHLRNKESIINNVLRRYGLNEIRIVTPEEIF